MPNRFRLQSAAVLFYTLAAFITLHILWFTNGTHVAGYDYFNYHWNFWWIRHALTTPSLNVFETNYVFFPHMNNLGYHALTAFWYPVWALVEPLAGTLTAMNIIIFLMCFLNGYLLFVFLRSEGVSPGIALVGGLALQISPVSRYFYYNTHVNLGDWFWLPAHLLLWKQIFTSIEAGNLRRAILWSVAQGLALWGLGLTDLQFPIFTAFLLAPYMLYTLWRCKKRVPLIAAGGLTLAVALTLLWFAGPLPYMRTFTGTLAPGSVDDRPGVPFPNGYLSMYEVWWYWDTPTLGGFVTVVTIISLIAGLSRLRRRMPSDRWLWFVLMLPPLLLSMGPNITLFGASIPMPFRLLHAITNGMFRMPWRLAPIFIIAALIFVAKTWTPILPRSQRYVALIAAFLILGLDARMFETAPLDPILYPYHFYETMGQERGEPYDDYVVIEVPTGVGTGEVIIGDPKATTYQFYGMTHEKRMVNGFISRAPTEVFWPLRTDDPLLSWLGQRRMLEPQLVEPELRQMISDWPVGYIVIHQDQIGRNGPTNQEIIGYFNALPDLLCPMFIEHDAVVFRTTWHPDGCPPRTPPQTESGRYQIDIGAPDDVRYIGWGWHWPEEVAGLNLRWTGEYPQTKIYIDLPPNAYQLEISAQAFWESRDLKVLVNDVPLDETATVSTDSLQTYSFNIPAEIIGDGQHVTLTLAYDSWIVPNEVGQSADPRKLAIAVDWIRFTTREPA